MVLFGLVLSVGREGREESRSISSFRLRNFHKFFRSPPGCGCSPDLSTWLFATAIAVDWKLNLAPDFQPGYHFKATYPDSYHSLPVSYPKGRPLPSLLYRSARPPSPPYTTSGTLCSPNCRKVFSWKTFTLHLTLPNMYRVTSRS